MKQAFKYLDKAAAANQSVLVHCVQGISRSASFVIAYLMYRSLSSTATTSPTTRLSLRDALTHTRDRRSIVSPNRGFLRQLGMSTCVRVLHMITIVPLQHVC
jgi:protein-tyrosine phosphatase